MDTPPPITATTPPQPQAQSDASADKLLAILSHLSPLIGVGILLPLIVWLIKRTEPSERDRLTAAHACEAFNFHLTLLIISIICLPFTFFFMLIPLVNVLFFIVWLPLMCLVGLITLIFMIIAAVKASEGSFYRYPCTLRFFK